MDIKEYFLKKAKEAKAGAKALAKLSSKDKNSILQKMAEALKKKAKTLIAENQKDIQFAEKKGLSKASIDRLTLNEKRIDEMAKGLMEVTSLPDPVGEFTAASMALIAATNASSAAPIVWLTCPWMVATRVVT